MSTASSGTDSPAPEILLRDLKSAARKAEHEEVQRLLAEWESCWGHGASYAEALSWAARAYCSKGHYEDAARCARDAYHLAGSLVLPRGEDPQTVAAMDSRQIAMGAAIEVEAQLAVAAGRKTGAVRHLREMLARHDGEPFCTRIRKNLLQLTLVGETALLIDGEALAGGTTDAVPLGQSPLLVFIWAHWCSDSRAQGRTLSRFFEGGAHDDLAVVAITRLFGYITKGTSVPEAAERDHIAKVVEAEYAWLAKRPRSLFLLSPASCGRYGASTFPTLVAVDRAGVVRGYHSGVLKLDAIAQWLGI